MLLFASGIAGSPVDLGSAPFELGMLLPMAPVMPPLPIDPGTVPLLGMLLPIEPGMPPLPTDPGTVPLLGMLPPIEPAVPPLPIDPGTVPLLGMLLLTRLGMITLPMELGTVPLLIEPDIPPQGAPKPCGPWRPPADCLGSIWPIGRTAP